LQPPLKKDLAQWSSNQINLHSLQTQVSCTFIILREPTPHRNYHRSLHYSFQKIHLSLAFSHLSIHLMNLSRVWQYEDGLEILEFWLLSWIHCQRTYFKGLKSFMIGAYFLIRLSLHS
jgi:hypothetical protein